MPAPAAGGVPSGFGTSIARPRLMWAGVIRLGLPSTTSKPTFISGIDRTRLDQRVADEVGEGDLAAAGAGEVVVDDGAVVPQQLHRDRADRGRGRHGERGVHVLRGAGRGAAQHGVRRLVAGRRRARRAATPWASGWWCPWRARRPWSRGAAWRPARASASGPARAPGPCCGGLRRRAFAGAGSAARGLRGRLRRCRCAAPVPWPLALEVLRPGRDRRCPGPAGTGRTSPRRATRWRRNRRTGGSDWLTWGLRHGLIRLFRYVHGGSSVVKARPPRQQMQTAGRQFGVVCREPQPGLAHCVRQQHHEQRVSGP